MIRVTLPGYPRIGRDRELKKVTEKYWRDGSLEADLLAIGKTLRERHWKDQSARGVDPVPVGDFSYYDAMLDAAVLFGCVPERYRSLGAPDSLAVYFAMARGTQDLQALEMTKWFDTNYHYIVPEVTGAFSLHPGRLLEQVREVRALGLNPKVVVPGPYTFLRLAKLGRLDLKTALERITPTYAELVRVLAGEGVSWIAFDEPALVLDEPAPADAVRASYATIAASRGKITIVVQTYFEEVPAANRDLLFSLPVDGFGFDLVRGPAQWKLLEDPAALPAGSLFIAGIVDGRNVWRTDLDATLDRLARAKEALGDRLVLSSSCSLLHLPYSAGAETGLDPEVREWVCFAEERLDELQVLARALNEGTPAVADGLARSRAILSARDRSTRFRDPAVRGRVDALDPSWFERGPFEARRAAQAKSTPLPLLPTTTIGSFPQSAEVRSERNRFRTGKITREQYESAVDERIRNVIRQQEEMGLDVLVHGEFERTDMVEYFAESLAGMLVTANGWVQSYGTRCVRPPLIYGDVSRPTPMTVRESRFAQSLTKKPVKGMLTGPVTILNWSFPRTDIPREEIAKQIALALRDETVDLEKAGIRVIQIDEPAFREGVPLREAGRKGYLEWAVRSFRLSASGVQPSTQIHTHMCYSDFNLIIEWIAAMDADVISIENSRSSSELLQAFDDFKYPRGIGPGVYDVHSERIAPTEEMEELLERSGKLLPRDLLWVNPDCGLKTRRDEEVMPTLRNMVEAARRVRARWSANRA